MKRILYLLLVLASLRAAGQNVTIDYQAWNPSGTTCSLFVNPTNVPATGTTSGTIEHQRKLGETVYNSSDLSIQIRTEYQTTGVVYKGGRYRIAYNFKAGYSYMVYITAAAVENTVGNNTGPYIRADINSNSGGGSTGCNGPETVNYNAGGNPPAYKLSSDAFQEYQFVFPQMGSQSTLEITAFPETNGGTKTVRIRKIRIVETAPAPAFSVTPSSASISCGSTTPVTFTATGTNIPSGATVTYSWNLGATPNGWLYNGNPAPQTISTGTTNTLTLTPDCGKALSSVSATVTANNNNYNTGNSVSVSLSQPSYSISGNTQLCSGNPLYTIPNLPCNATVSWSATPSGVVTVDCPTCASTTLTKVGDGQVTLTATITACGVTQTESKNITVGIVPSSAQIYTSPFYVSYPLFAGQSSYNICFTQRDIALNFPGATNLVAYAYSGPYVTSIVGTVINWAYDSYNYSQTIRVEYDVACGHAVQVLSFYNTCRGYYYRMSPNPSSTEVVVSDASPNKGKYKGQKTITELNLYDATGNLRKRQAFSKASSAVLNVSDLPAGIYYLEIVDGAYKERQKLIISK